MVGSEGLVKGRFGDGESLRVSFKEMPCVNLGIEIRSNIW